MKYPWVDKFVMHAAPEDLPQEDTGTNEPVDTTNTEDMPDSSLAEDLTGETIDQTNTDSQMDTTQPEESIDMTGNDQLQQQIDDLKKQIDDLQGMFDLEEEVSILKKRIDNINIPDDPDMNDSIFQSASSEVKYIKRAMRRFVSKTKKQSGLTGDQEQLIINELEQTPELSCQEVAFKLAPQINVTEQDIVDFIRNTDYRFRHRHRRDASVIDWAQL
jgi:hypothetical protein